MQDETNKPPLSQDPDINPQAGSVDDLPVADESPPPAPPTVEQAAEGSTRTNEE